MKIVQTELDEEEYEVKFVDSKEITINLFLKRKALPKEYFLKFTKNRAHQ